MGFADEVIIQRIMRRINKKSIIEEKRIERNGRKHYETGQEAGGDPWEDS